MGGLPGMGSMGSVLLGDSLQWVAWWFSRTGSSMRGSLKGFYGVSVDWVRWRFSGMGSIRGFLEWVLWKAFLNVLYGWFPGMGSMRGFSRIVCMGGGFWNVFYLCSLEWVL